MTAQDYQNEYYAQSGKNKQQAHSALVGAERALAQAVAPVYFAALANGNNTDGQPPVSLATTGEMGAYYAAWGTVELNTEIVDQLTPTR